jgi:hypothetical protein
MYSMHVCEGHIMRFVVCLMFSRANSRVRAVSPYVVSTTLVIPSLFLLPLSDIAALMTTRPRRSAIHMGAGATLARNSRLLAVT